MTAPSISSNDSSGAAHLGRRSHVGVLLTALTCASVATGCSASSGGAQVSASSAAAGSASATGAVAASAAASGSSTSGGSTSPNCTTIPGASAIVDSAGEIWTLAPSASQGNQVALDGKVDTSTHQVVLLLYQYPVVYQENDQLNWWGWIGGAWVAQSGDPRAGGSCTGATTSGASVSSTSGGALSTSTSGSPSSSGSTSGPPPAAARVGYRTLTYGPNVTLGENWFDWNFYGAGSQVANAGFQDGGLLYITGNENNGYGATYASAQHAKTGKDWTGTAFGGGAYFEAVLSFTGQGNGPYGNGGPAFWSLDIEHTSQGPYNVIWPGQDAGYNDFFEVDFMEYDVNEYSFQNGVGNWYGYGKGTANPYQAVGGAAGSVLVTPGTDFSQFHKYGTLWVPATTGTLGYLQFFFDDAQTGPTFFWRYNDPAKPFPPPPVPDNPYALDGGCYDAAFLADGGCTAMAGMDQRHQFMILGTGTNQPMIVQSVSVWQSSASDNLTQP